MSDNSSIEWTDATWNFVTGCTKISEGCRHCYIERTPPFRMSGRRFDKPGVGGTTGVVIHPDRIVAPLRWRKPRRVFVNSLSDLFHPHIPREIVARAWAVMAATPQHTYQVLTKRPERAARILGTSGDGYDAFGGDLLFGDVPGAAALMDAPWPLNNVWLGTSVESADYLRRIDALRAAPAAVRFVSAEPLLGPLDGIDLTGIDWLIAGGESGPGARLLDLGWVRELRDACAAAGTAFFVKQLGSEWAHAAGYPDKGNQLAAWPADLRVREYPAGGGRTAAA
jgi:protein gp37